ncbi:MFS transporter [Paenibacillus glycanilyticus]|uniref:MFS transporter n=1 Tax=Paenibacillus glycanilyticus TaxID=126569 RepID=UPI0037C655B5|nr:MFS transporter [Paenibacillus glycanilyticus]
MEFVGNYAKPNTKATYQTIFVAVSSGLGGIIGNSAGGIILEYKGAPFLYLVLCLLCTAASCLFLVMQQGKFTRADVERAAG